MSIFVYKDEFGQIVFLDDGVVIVFFLENGDIFGYIMFNVWFLVGGEIVDGLSVCLVVEVRVEMVVVVNVEVQCCIFMIVLDWK